MTKLEKLAENLCSQDKFASLVVNLDLHEITVECMKVLAFDFLAYLKDDPAYAFDQLIDLCVVDYLEYGESDWETNRASDRGFSRASTADINNKASVNFAGRFAVVYHLLSTTLNQRLRVKVFVSEEDITIPSVHSIWKSANWFEREAYDLYGVLFVDHPDLRRILTDYGFIGYPFRKDFPVSGHVEMRYDAKLEKVIYEPVDIEPRILEPRVVRNDSRYIDEK